ncbi:MAG: hypothetical protein IPJ69_13175 [Deltaproteobacteria bacterium]|nr:MAG: hypothetical protein IPJ69_13175 [Deltaproteobacteria bacterium]
MKKELFGVMMAATMVSVLYLSGPFGCSSTSSGGDIGGGVTSDISENFPADLAVASPTAAQSTGAGLVIAGHHKAVELSSDADLQTKQEAIAELLAATNDAVTDCDFTLDLRVNTNNATCYGPELTYSNHPDLSGIGDGDTNNDDPLGQFNDTDGDGSLPTGDVGLWTENNGDTAEACASAQMNAKVEGIASQVDSAMLAMASMYCLANVNSISLPSDVGDSVDLTSVVSSGFSSNGIGITVTAAGLSRAADDVDGNAVYIATLEGTASQESNTYAVDFRLKHIPTSTDASSYKGKLSYTIGQEGVDSQGCDPHQGITYATSIEYEKASVTSMTYALNNGTYCLGDDIYTSGSDYTVNPSATWSGNFNKVLFNYNPSTSVGNYSFAWQAGYNDDNARVMNMSIAESGASTTGTAFFGYGPKVYEDGAGSIEGMICNWAGPGAAHTPIEIVQRQELSLNNESGLFETTSSDITYAPTNTCDSTGSGQGGTFTYSDGTTTVNTAVDNTLVDLTAIATAYTEPTAPADVDE